MHLWSDNLYDNMVIAFFIFLCRSGCWICCSTTLGRITSRLVVATETFPHLATIRRPLPSGSSSLRKCVECGDCCFGDQFRELYERKEAAMRAFVGIHVLHSHALLLRDPALIRRILVEDFPEFSSSFKSTDAIRDTMGSGNLLFTKYKTWWETHKIFAVRTSGKNLTDSRGSYEKKKKLNGAESVELEVKQLCALFTTDIFAKFAESRGRVSSNVY